jgi:hypothetical protein
MSRKPRIDADGPGVPQQLRNLPWEEVEFLVGQREQVSAAKLIAQISSRHGISPISEQRLSDFWRWADSQVALHKMNQDAEQFRNEFAKQNPAATFEEAHESTLAYLHLKSVREDDTKLAQFVAVELRKVREGSREDRKLALLEQKAAQALETVEDSKLSDAQKADRIREIFKK